MLPPPVESSERLHAHLQVSELEARPGDSSRSVGLVDCLVDGLAEVLEQVDRPRHQNVDEQPASNG